MISFSVFFLKPRTQMPGSLLSPSLDERRTLIEGCCVISPKTYPVVYISLVLVPPVCFESPISPVPLFVFYDEDKLCLTVVPPYLSFGRPDISFDYPLDVFLVVTSRLSSLFTLDARRLSPLRMGYAIPQKSAS